MYISDDGPQGPVSPACQKFSTRSSRTIRSSGTPVCFQSSIASSSGPRPSSSSPPNTVAQIRSGSNPKPFSDRSHPNSIASRLKYSPKLKLPSISKNVR